jgi:hypothetical protein
MPLPLKHRSGLSLTRREGDPYDGRAEKERQLERPDHHHGSRRVIRISTLARWAGNELQEIDKPELEDALRNF